MSHQPNNVFAGTQVVSLVEVRGTNPSLVHPRGAVGVVTRTPSGETDTDFLVRFPDGFEASNILECLYSPLPEKQTALAVELLDMRDRFLSQMIFQTFNGYALSQFKKIEQDHRARAEIRWKHAMHLLRLLLSGAATLREGRVPVRVEVHRDRLLAVKSGGIPWAEVEAWRKELHHDFERALSGTRLPERPDYEAANRFLIKARREMADA
jgi:hypothetical protein